MLPKRKNTPAIHHRAPVRKSLWRWQSNANCKGRTELMFPRHHKDVNYITQARFICSECKVVKYCLQEALQYHPIDMHGVWAGLTSRQLAQEQKKQGLKPSKPSISQMWEHMCQRTPRGQKPTPVANPKVKRPRPSKSLLQSQE